MERSRRLHNFTLPRSWGTQRLLRCMNIDPSTHQFYGVRIQRSYDSDPDSDSDSDSGPMDRHLIDQRKLKLKLHPPAPPPEPNPDDIGLTREKLMLDFKAAVSKMKDAILTGASEEEEPEMTPPVKAKRGSQDGDETCGGGGEEVNVSPPPSIRTRTMRLRRDSGEKERPKFSVSLSRSEIEEDFIAMVGRRLPRKPTKRPKIVQNQLDSLFPGSWLTEVNPDLYRVNDGDQKTKKSKHKSKLLRFETEMQRDEEES